MKVIFNPHIIIVFAVPKINTSTPVKLVIVDVKSHLEEIVNVLSMLIDTFTAVLYSSHSSWVVQGLQYLFSALQQNA